MRWSFAARTLFACLLVTLAGSTSAFADRLNVIVVTVDDMSCDSVGVFGCQVPDTTPRMDAFASTALRFEHAHTQVGNCMPCRNVLMTGLYPHQNGVEGFRQVRPAKVPQLSDDFGNAGYLTAIRGKASHSNPYHPYPGWDLQLGSEADKKDPATFGESTREAIEAAREAGKPLFLSINISDPHLPFYAYSKGKTFDDPNMPSRVFTEDEVVIPGFLFDHPTVRKELAHYYSSVRRADDAFGSILDAVDAAGAADNTLIVFFSDHGMPLPFAKTQLYHHSTHTPLMVRWPGVTSAGSVDVHHMVSVVDIAPTLLEATEAKTEREMSGRSFAPLLRGQTQENRDYVIKTYYENSGRNRQPMRSIQTRTLGYIFNPWSGRDPATKGGYRDFATATDGTATYKVLAELGRTDPALGERLRLMDNRVPEELYDYSVDADALNNLIDSPEHAKELDDLRAKLLAEMERIDDPLTELFRVRDPVAIADYMDQLDRETAALKAASRKRNRNAKKETASLSLIRLTPPKSFEPGQQVTLTVRHTLPKELGQQTLTVTLKDANGTRLDRQTVSANGTGKVLVPFDVPADVTGIQFATFVGDDYPSTPQHESTRVIKAE